MSLEKENMLWVEKYRPKKISDTVIPEKTKKVFQSFVDNKSMPNLLLCGSAGIGKTTVAIALCEEMQFDYMVINGTNEGRLMDTLRSKITDFASTVSFRDTRKVIILDEADGIPPLVQDALRNFIEEYSANCGFILTCNYVNQIREPIHSRTTTVDFTLKSEDRPHIAKEMYLAVKKILDAENIKYDNAAVQLIVKRYFPDFRRTINELQRYSSTGMIDKDVLSIGNDVDVELLVKYLKEKDYKEIRKWVATNPNLELNRLCRSLYDQMYTIVKPNYIPQFVIDMADYQYKHNFVADKEINIVAMLYDFMVSLEFIDA